MKFAFLIIFFIYSFSLSASCIWCIEKNIEIENELKNLLKLKPSQILESIEAKGIKVVILKPERLPSKKFFTWGSIRINSGKLTDLSKNEGTLGKTLCKGERPISKTGMTIVISSDAPLSTLLHEYLHYRQILLDHGWCEISKKLWDNPKPKFEWAKAVRDREWDVRLTLWKLRNESIFNVEDRIVISEGLIQEAIFRSQFDKSSLNIIKELKVENFLNENVKLYLKEVPTVKVKATPQINIPYRRN